MPKGSFDQPTSEADHQRAVDDLYPMSQWERKQFTLQLAQATVNYLRQDHPELKEGEAVENIRDYYAVLWRYIDEEFHRLHHRDSLARPGQSLAKVSWPDDGYTSDAELADDPCAPDGLARYSEETLDCKRGPLVPRNPLP